MKIYEIKSTFGWKNDSGIGEQLIQQIMRGEKTATASPKTLYSQDELEKLLKNIGKPCTVLDKTQQPRCNIQILEIFESKFGRPDQRLLEGEGFGSDFHAFKDAHRNAWRDLVESGKLQLDDETVLVVEMFKLLDT
jgi:uncharacterized protein YhfF